MSHRSRVGWPTFLRQFPLLPSWLCGSIELISHALPTPLHPCEVCCTSAFAHGESICSPRWQFQSRCSSFIFCLLLTWAPMLSRLVWPECSACFKHPL